jgi:hypothetical protein
MGAAGAAFASDGVIEINTGDAANIPAFAYHIAFNMGDTEAEILWWVPGEMHTDEFKAKLDRGDDTVLGTGATPLLRAAKAADVAAMRLLLAHGADPTLTNGAGTVNDVSVSATLRRQPGGVNPLMIAAARKDFGKEAGLPEARFYADAFVASGRSELAA